MALQAVLAFQIKGLTLHRTLHHMSLLSNAREVSRKPVAIHNHRRNRVAV